MRTGARRRALGCLPGQSRDRPRSLCPGGASAVAIEGSTATCVFPGTSHTYTHARANPRRGRPLHPTPLTLHTWVKPRRTPALQLPAPTALAHGAVMVSSRRGPRPAGREFLTLSLAAGPPLPRPSASSSIFMVLSLPSLARFPELRGAFPSLAGQAGPVVSPINLLKRS